MRFLMNSLFMSAEKLVLRYKFLKSVIPRGPIIQLDISVVRKHVSKGIKIPGLWEDLTQLSQKHATHFNGWILTDSQATFKALANPKSKSKMVNNLKILLNFLQQTFVSGKNYWNCYCDPEEPFLFLCPGRTKRNHYCEITIGTQLWNIFY